jgi:predicted nuclease with RNAse H fold
MEHEDEHLKAEREDEGESLLEDMDKGKEDNHMEMVEGNRILEGEVHILGEVGNSKVKEDPILVVFARYKQQELSYRY